MPRHWDPENLISTKWLHNKGWIPVPSTGMTAIYVIHHEPSYRRGISA
ncbi:MULTISPECIES: WPE palindromic element domain-containing protein [unclassified Wolbachia]|nr:WPE palindromic element domain-containing protein [Wolbachia endosymbiont (group A) of Apoderus coryli]